MTLDFILHQRSGEGLELFAAVQIGNLLRHEILENRRRPTQDGWLGNGGHDELDEYLIKRFTGRTVSKVEFRGIGLCRAGG